MAMIDHGDPISPDGETGSHSQPYSQSLQTAEVLQ